MGAIKHKLNWDKPRVLNPSLSYLPWINLCIIIIVTIPAIIIGFALIIADSSIQGSLVIGEQKNLWFTISFFLLLATIVPIANWCAERFGDKTIFFIGATLFFIPTFFSAFTTNYWMMMFLRAFSALGAGSIFPTTLTIIDRMFDPKQKSFAVAIYIACAFGLGTAGGTFIGGYSAEFLSWPAIFLLAASSAPLVLLCTWLFFQERERAKEKHFDFLGTFLYLILIGSLVTGLANVKEPWTTEGADSPWMISCGLLFFFSLSGFIWRELTFSEPLINIRLFKVRPFTLGNISIFIVASTFFSTVTNLSEIFEKQLHYSKYQIGLLQIPFGLYIGICGSISGLLTKKIGIRIPAVLGMSLVALSCFTQHSLTIQSDHSQFFLLQALRGIGIGFSLGPFTALALKRIQIENIGQAAVIITLFRQFGGALGSIIINLIQAIRFPFHLLRFGEQMVLNSPALDNHLRTVDTLLVNQGGSIPTIEPYSAEGLTEVASVRGLAQLREYAAAQAHILSINDAYFLIGWAASIILVIVLFFMLRAKFKERHPLP
ncbi:MAG: MFS transporter [Simkaniaceae bacterium]|nr:MAG: MFS transporter [Simkaniaceae bacterium]